MRRIDFPLSIIYNAAGRFSVCQNSETAGSVLAKLVQAHKAGAPNHEIRSLAQQLAAQTNCQLCGEATVAVTIEGEIISEPAD